MLGLSDKDFKITIIDMLKGAVGRRYTLHKQIDNSHRDLI